LTGRIYVDRVIDDIFAQYWSVMNEQTDRQTNGLTAFDSIVPRHAGVRQA